MRVYSFHVSMWLTFILLLNTPAGRIFFSSEIVTGDLLHVLVGNVTSSSATFSIRTQGAASLKIALYPVKEQGLKVEHRLSTQDRSWSIIQWTAESLAAEMEYEYTIQLTGSDEVTTGKFRTFPKGQGSYKVVFGSCQETASESPIFQVMKNENPLFFLQTGDLHYENIGADCDQKFEETYTRVFLSNAQRALFQSTAFVYMWDDHDFGPNNTDATNPCRTTSIRYYDSFLPHYPFAIQDSTGPISHRFDAGRITYVISDLRSQKNKPVYEDCTRKKTGTNFGSEAHLQWFFQTLLEAKKKGHVVAWMTGFAWINAPGGPNYKCNETDNWGGYPEERKRIANFIKENQIPVFILSGDAHMVAMDDGTNSDYAEGRGAPIRVFHAAAIDRPGSYKGGPYSHGYSQESGQFGILEVEDDGGKQICFSWKAKNKWGEPVKNQEGKEIKMDFCMDIP